MAIALACTSPAAHAAVELNVTRIGFPTLRSGDVYRRGAWVPVIVDLALVDQAAFNGYVRIGQLDIDGDECYDRIDVHLRAGSRETQRLHLYALANPERSQGRMAVELFDAEGAPVRVLSQGNPTFQVHLANENNLTGISDDTILVLSLSTGVVGKIQELATAEQQARYLRPLRVAHMSPGDLPELWIGLDIVDYIVWDNARPDLLTGPQLEALVEWVRQGGTLLMAASRSAASVKQTAIIDDVLPVELGHVTSVANLPAIRKALMEPPPSSQPPEHPEPAGEPEWWEKPFPRSIASVECALRPGAKTVPDEDDASNVLTRRRLGGGQVIFCAVTLRDLFKAPGSAVGFFDRLFHLRRLEGEDAVRPEPRSMFQHVVRAVSFSDWGSLYLLFAGLSSLLYVLVATFGVWAFLGPRGWRHHSWSVFAIVAIAASLLSVFAVNAVRGFGGETLHQISIVDLEAGVAHGRATALFGFKTGSDKELNLWLPSDSLGATEPGRTPCFLRPMPEGSTMMGSSNSFADSEAYRLVPGSAVVKDVRIRGTLKRFEGRWSGPVRGTIEGRIAVSNSRIIEGSYLVNGLGVDLVDCYLLQAKLDLPEALQYRNKAINAFPIGSVPSDGSKVDLAERCYGAENDGAVVGVDAEPTPSPTLEDAQLRWKADFEGYFASLTRSEIPTKLGGERTALLLLSTAGEYEPGTGTSGFGNWSWSRDRLRRLDLREELTTDSVILIGFAEDPGPVRLFRSTGDRPWRMLEPDIDKSWTMYRIRIPVTRLGA